MAETLTKAERLAAKWNVEAIGCRCDGCIGRWIETVVKGERRACATLAQRAMDHPPAEPMPEDWRWSLAHRLLAGVRDAILARR